MIEIIDSAEFRRKLAGLEDPAKRGDALSDRAVDMEASSFIARLPEVFGEELDRKTLWDRIAHGMQSSVAKCGGDLSRCINDLLSYIKADVAQVAANDGLSMHIETLLSRPKEDQQKFLDVISSKSYIVVTRARSVWNMKKTPKPDVVKLPPEKEDVIEEAKPDEVDFFSDIPEESDHE